MNASTVRKAIAALIIANIIWGAAAVVFKISLENIPPFTLAFWRFFIATVIMIPFVWKNLSLNLRSRKDFILLILNAIFGITFNILFFFLGLKLTYAINAPVIASSGPILTLILATLFLSETFQFKKLLGMILGTIGILLIILEPLLLNGIGGSVTGNILLLLATLGAVGHTITGRSLFSRYNAIKLSWWTIMIGALSFLPLAVYEYTIVPNLYQVLDWRGFMGLGFGAVLSSSVAYTLFNWGLGKIPATDAVMFTYIDPIIGSILAYFVLHEPITIPFVVGALCIFGGLYIAERRVPYHPLHKLLPTRNKKSLLNLDIEEPTLKDKERKESRYTVIQKLYSKTH